MTILWRNELSVGDPMIDADHKQLISIINAAEDVINESGSRRDLERVLKRLDAYTKEHFVHEEQLQKRIGYPAHEDHVAEHRKLIETLDDIRARVGRAKDAYSYERALEGVAGMLQDWLMRHVMQHDMRMRPYIMKARQMPTRVAS